MNNNSNNKKVAIMMSGGVDSSVAALLLKNQGYDVIGVTAKTDNSPVSENAKKVAEKLNIPHYTFDLTDFFEENIINYFKNSYKNGETPNPCIICNNKMKWGKLFELAQNELNCEYIATGHYAKIINNLLYPAKNSRKDQLYFLCRLTREMLSKTIFPLSDFQDKEEIRKIAEEYDLPSKSAKDSQDICFIKNTSFNKYIENFVENKKGNFVLNSTGQKLGIHNGIYKYTIGQRKGIGLAYLEPLYVVKTDIKSNTVYVDTKQHLYSKEVSAIDVNLQDDKYKYIKEFRANVKIRYNMGFQPAKVTISDNGCKITFDNDDVSLGAKGQFAVFYDEKDFHLIGSGIITQ